MGPKLPCAGRRTARPSLTLLCVLLLGGCAGPPPAPVEERHAAPPRRIDYHFVAPGETLYSIAWRYGLDFRRLAAANNIGSSYAIRAGQRLTLVVSGSGVTASPPPRRAPSATSAALPAAPGSTPEVAIDAWHWPARGPIIQRFGAGTVAHKGIDIRGDMGEPVLAANRGTVVYAGNGLVGYGNLLIIKHNDRYLSAYGHNRRVLVTEGQRIKVGQPIAEIGDSGTDTAKLHFELRLDGRPVDPIRLLPPR